MKKVLTILAVAAALAAVSCTKELERSAADSSTVTFTVDAGQISTRAVSGKHGTATRLQVGVYLKGSGETYSFISAISQNKTEVVWPTVVSLELARNETYKIVFWADEGANAYTINWENGTVAETATTIDGNAVNRDAYYKLVEITPSGSTSESITLVRPLAQVNVGTNDLTKYKTAADYDGNIETQVVINGVAPGINLLTGEAAAGEPIDLTFSYADNLDATLVSGGSEFSYLGMNYILCPADNTLTAQIALRKNGATENINSFTVSNMPVKPNYRTNVVGKLLTGTVEYTVDVDTDFNSDLDKQVGPSFENVTALNAYFATMADNSDHGDINPEVVTLKAIADGDTIVLPAIAGDVRIYANATCEAGTLNIVYGDTSDGAKKPANIDFYVSKLGTLNATVPASHFELLSGSIVVNEAIVSTNSTTFVIQNGAKVGTAKIQKGNATIAGTVTTVSVPAGATADGTSPVQVFLENVASVEQIELKAQTDVVVEQPKDQIDVTATEKKVAVYVKDGAQNSTATAQNGGVIYVKAEVACSVIADGTSEAEDGSAASSTVIIESGAAGSTVSAENGAAINLTANGACAVVSEGTSDDSTPVPSNVTVTSASAEVSAMTADDGTVTTTAASVDNVTVTENGVAITGGKVYETLQAAVDNCVDGGVVEILKDIDLTTVSSSINGEANAKYNVVIQGKGLTLKGNNHSIKASSGKRPLALAGIGKAITVKDLTINANGGTNLWLIASNMVVTLDNVVVDGSNCTESYNQVVTIGSGYTGIELNVVNGSVIKTNDDGSAHYDIIAWSPATINVNNSTLKGWANIYIKPDASGSEVYVSNSIMQSRGYSGYSNSFGMISVECANNTITLDNVDAHSTSSGDMFNTLINVSKYWASQAGVSAYPNEFYILNNTTFEGDGTKYTGIMADSGWGVFNPGMNSIYFDETAAGNFASLIEETPFAHLSDTVNENNLYPLIVLQEASGTDGQTWSYFATLADALGDASMGQVNLLKDITLSDDIVAAMEEGYFIIVPGEFNIAANGHAILVKHEVSAVWYVDQETDVFKCLDENDTMQVDHVEGYYYMYTPVEVAIE